MKNSRILSNSSTGQSPMTVNLVMINRAGWDKIYTASQAVTGWNPMVNGSITRCAVMLAFHDADADTDTDTDSPNTATILRPIHAISSRGLARK